ncbi:MAG: site-specific integrase [Sulfurimonas sp.]|nr:site-specific integrase [Sulfurimonas sp.]MBU3939993.1 site-specific integrase [bacterium]MBU4025627.1 site-specific integrase [bacterium]MBU4058578.1 site-specific integrase [bacterium]MBU4109764.1 site-specific integrase [bacterium]
MSKFNHYSSLFLEFKKHELKFSTFDKYTNIVRDRLNPFFGEMEVNQIKPSDVKRWLYAITDVGGKSKQIFLGVLSGILQEALYDEVIEKNPVRMVRPPKNDKNRIKPFTADEVNQIMNLTSNDNYRYYLAIAFYTGMRSGEIIALKKSDIDFEKRIISVKRTRSRFGESTPKTRTSIRNIPIIELLMPYISDLYFTHEHEYLFVTQYNKPYNTTNVFQEKFWKPSLKELGIEYRRPYNARHTYATNMLYNNLVTPVQLAQLLGHANTQMVFDVYVNYLDSFNNDFDRSINIYK